MRIVTVILIGIDDDDTYTYSSSKAVDDDLDKMIAEARMEATEIYLDNVEAVPSRHRYIVHVDELPEIPYRQSVVSAVLPQVREDEQIQVTVE